MPELEEDRYMSDVLNDNVWNELTLDQADDLVRKHKSLANRNLANIAQELRDANGVAGPERWQKRRELHRRRASTVSFLDMLTQRGARTKRALARRNMIESDNENGRMLGKLKVAIREHRAVTSNANATDTELDQADVDLYAALEKVTGGKG